MTQVTVTTPSAYPQPYNKPANNTWSIPSHQVRWSGEKAAQVVTTVCYETDEDVAEGTLSLLPNTRLVVRSDGAVFAGVTGISRDINWESPFSPISETVERNGQVWQVLVNTSGRDLWVELSQYQHMIAVAVKANEALNREENSPVKTWYFVKTAQGFVYQIGGRKSGLHHEYHPNLRQLRRGRCGEDFTDYIHAMCWEKEATAHRMAKKFGGQVVKVEFRNCIELSRQTLTITH